MANSDAPTDAPLRLRPLTVVEDGRDIIVGDPETGIFVAVPPVGGVVVRALLAGASFADAAARAGCEVENVAAFVDKLNDVGFVERDGAHAPRSPIRTAPIQQRDWIGGPAADRVRPLFGRVAWTAYVTFAAFCAVVFVTHPRLWPRSRDAFVFAAAAPSLLLLFPLSLAAVALHECWHWLAARAAGVRARFGMDRRLYFLVFETDLSLLWGLPRRRRYGPLLAGAAADVTVLAILLAVELSIEAAWWSPPGLIARMVAAVVFVECAALLWQCLVFLRTDFYAVLMTATGCRSLWRVKTLLIRQAFGRLTTQQATELAAADPHDVMVGRWFRWLWLAGLVAAAGWFAEFCLPVIVRVLRTSGPGLAVGPTRGSFWLALAGLAMIAWRFVLPAVLAVRDRGQRRAIEASRPSERAVDRAVAQDISAP